MTPEHRDEIIDLIVQKVGASSDEKDYCRKMVIDNIDMLKLYREKAPKWPLGADIKEAAESIAKALKKATNLIPKIEAPFATIFDETAVRKWMLGGFEAGEPQPPSEYSSFKRLLARAVSS